MSTKSARDLFPSFKTVTVLTAIVLAALLAIVPFVVAIAAATGSAG
jgi:hypothetical protein